MNPYAFRNRLSKFGSPQQLVADASNAQQLPGQAAGNVAGQQDNDLGVFMPPGTPGTQPFKYSMGLNVDTQRAPVGSNMNQIPGMSTLGEPESNLLLSPQQKRLMMEQMSRQGGVPGEAPGFNPGVR